MEIAGRRDGGRNHRVPALPSWCCWRRWRYRLFHSSLFFRVLLVCPCFLSFLLVSYGSEHQGRLVL